MSSRYQFCFSLFCTTFCLLPISMQPVSSFAQSPTLPIADGCAANPDCSVYLWNFGLLERRDDQLVAIPGKKPENRSHTLLQAGSYLTQHSGEVDSASHFRYLNCVSSALWAERGENKTLFSSENIIETYFAIAGKENELAPNIQRACDMLKAYHARIEQARDERSILQNRADGPDPEYIWHSILLDFVRKEMPREDAEANVRKLQEKYCFFAMQCRSADHSPFAGK
jgi:hypothetical protein